MSKFPDFIQWMHQEAVVPNPNSALPAPAGQTPAPGQAIRQGNGRIAQQVPPPPPKTRAEKAQALADFEAQRAGPQGPIQVDPTKQHPYAHMRMPNGQPFPPPPPGEKVPYPMQHLLPKPPAPPPRKPKTEM